MPILPETLQNLHKGTVQELNLAPYSMSRADIETIIQCLPNNLNLKAILFGSCQFDREVLEALAAAVELHPALIELSLGCDNEIGDIGAKAFASVLENNQTLASLHLCRGNIGDAGARALARALKANHSLHILDVSDNKIGDDGAAAFAEIFPHNRSLTRLRLDGNRIAYTGGAALSKALEGNQTLVEFTITSNKVSETLTGSIERAFEGSKNIINLKIDGNRVISVCHENKKVVMEMFEKLKTQRDNLPQDDVRRIRERIYSIAYVAEQDLRVPRYEILDLMGGLQKHVTEPPKAVTAG